MSLAEILLILVVILIVLGPERLPELARMLGRGMREIRKASNMFRDTFMLEEQQPGSHRPDQMMPSSKSSGRTPEPDSEPEGRTTRGESLATHAADWHDFDSVRAVELSPPARTEVSTLRARSLEPQTIDDAVESRVALDPPVPPDIW